MKLPHTFNLDSSTILYCAPFRKVPEQCGRHYLPMGTTMRFPVPGGLRLSKPPFAPSHSITALTSRLTTTRTRPPIPLPTRRAFHATLPHQQTPSPSTPPAPAPPTRQPSPHTSFYKTHGRALFKALTLAFFSYQVCYYAWLVLETEETKDRTSREIKSLEGEVRLLDEGRRSHLPKS